MTIAVIGTGHIGGTLARAFSAAGLPTVAGSRHPDDAGADLGSAPARSIAEAIAEADRVVLALPGDAAEEFLHDHGAALDGRLIVDATNNMGGGALNQAAAVASHAAGARYARAFNSLGWQSFANPEYGGVTADLFFSCAPADRAAVEELITAVGLRPVYAGEHADVVDGAGRLWMAVRSSPDGPDDFAFRMITR